MYVYIHVCIYVYTYIFMCMCEVTHSCAWRDCMMCFCYVGSARNKYQSLKMARARCWCDLLMVTASKPCSFRLCALRWCQRQLVCVTWLNHVCYMTCLFDIDLLCVWHDLCTCATVRCLHTCVEVASQTIHTCDVTLLSVWHDIRLCGMTQSQVWYDSSTHAMCHICEWLMPRT